MKDIMKLIDEIENNIVLYDIGEFKQNIVILIDIIISYLPTLKDDNVKKINEIFYYMNNALSSKDYLLYGDILYYELRPVIERLVEES